LRGLSAGTGAHCPSFVSETLCFGSVFEVELFSVFCFFCFTSSVIRYSQKEPNWDQSTGTDEPSGTLGQGLYYYQIRPRSGQTDDACAVSEKYRQTKKLPL